MPPNLLVPVHDLLMCLGETPLDIQDIQKVFTTNPAPTIHSYGLSFLAPFMGRTFVGQAGVREYFEIIASVLVTRQITFETAAHWLIDSDSMVVSLRGSASFVWTSTGERWRERFMYRIELARDVSYDPNKSGILLVSSYEVWADTGAAYLARTGRMSEAESDYDYEDEDYVPDEDETSDSSSSSDSSTDTGPYDNGIFIDPDCLIVARRAGMMEGPLEMRLQRYRSR